MTKGTPSKGRKNKAASHKTCRRCGRHSYHRSRRICSYCGFGRMRKWRNPSWKTRYHAFNGKKSFHR